LAAVRLPRIIVILGEVSKIIARVTVPGLITMKHDGCRITMITAYDATFASIVDEAGVDVILVGDSVGTVMQGVSTTIPVTLDEMEYHVKMVYRHVR
jgi:3-methyl-2-oxobutanoate hydroxymethyltransferase